MLQRGPSHFRIGLGALQVCVHGWDLSTGPGTLGTGQLVGTQLGGLLGSSPQRCEDQTPWLEWH